MRFRSEAWTSCRKRSRGQGRRPSGSGRPGPARRAAAPAATGRRPVPPAGTAGRAAAAWRVPQQPARRADRFAHRRRPRYLFLRRVHHRADQPSAAASAILDATPHPGRCGSTASPRVCTWQRAWPRSPCLPRNCGRSTPSCSPGRRCGRWHTVSSARRSPCSSPGRASSCDGLLNIAHWYAWQFPFTVTHYWVAWVTVGALLVHLGVKAPRSPVACARALPGAPRASRPQ